MSAYWCKDCGGETVSCDCPEVDDYAAEDYVAEEYLAEDIDDRSVVWTVNDAGVGRVEVQQ
jgi:hypothetical protein